MVLEGGSSLMRYRLIGLPDSVPWRVEGSLGASRFIRRLASLTFSTSVSFEASSGAGKSRSFHKVVSLRMARLSSLGVGWSSSKEGTRFSTEFVG